MHTNLQRELVEPTVITTTVSGTIASYILGNVKAGFKLGAFCGGLFAMGNLAIIAGQSSASVANESTLEKC